MKTKKLIEKIIFDSKVLLIPFYLGLIVGMCCYAWIYFKQVYHLMAELNDFSKDSMMLALLELVDMVMIAWLVRSIITGSYNSAITKDHGYSGENITSGLLKVKMSTSIISVSIILMLQSYINANNVSWDYLLKKSLIHCIFLITGIVLAYAEYLHDLGDSINPHDTDGIHDPKINKDEPNKH